MIGVVREHHPLGVARGARRHHDEGVAFFDSDTVPQGVVFAVGADDPGRPERAEDPVTCRGGKAGVEHRRRVSGVPHRSECIDKPPPTREVKCDEFGHRPVA